MSGPRRYHFEVEGVPIVGHLHVPATSEPSAMAVLTGPLTSVKEQATGAYARALAERGLVALAFDHRTFGESGGEPRQFENPFAKVQDIEGAVSALFADRDVPDVPLLGVGVCAGGGYMARAVAEDSRFQGFAAVASCTSRGAVANYVNAFAVQSLAYTATFDSLGAAARIAVPTLVVHSEHALAPPMARRFISSLTGPHEELWLPSLGQIDFYDQRPLIDAAADAIVNFFARRLWPEA
jgi:uncharacterized protein